MRSCAWAEIVAAAPPPLAKVKPLVQAAVPAQPGESRRRRRWPQDSGRRSPRACRWPKAIAAAGVQLPPAQKVLGAAAPTCCAGATSARADLDSVRDDAGHVKTMPIPTIRASVPRPARLGAAGRCPRCRNCSTRCASSSRPSGNEYGDQFARAVERESRRQPQCQICATVKPRDGAARRQWRRRGE
jgi:peptidyl-prolyl cis-trans isomerase D